MTITWQISPSPIPYPDACQAMEDHVQHMIDGSAEEKVWLLEHPPLYTAGTSAKEEDLLVRPAPFPVYQTGRGGQYTYHGPGQRIAYVMLNLKNRGSDIRLYVHQLESWIIETLADLGIKGERRDGRVGIWVIEPDGRESKIAAIGVRVRKWISFHGIAINLAPDLSHYGPIVPCGIKEFGVTSISKFGIDCSRQKLDQILQDKWDLVFSV